MNISPRVLKLTLACVVGMVTIVMVNNWYRSKNITIQNNALTGQQISPNKKQSGNVQPPLAFLDSNNVPQQKKNIYNPPPPKIEIKRKPTKCGETDDDFRYSGLETVKPLTERVSEKFRSKEASCTQKNFPKPNDKLTPEETRRKTECVKNWVRDHRQGSGSFWTGTVQYVRHSHHTYLNEDSTVFDIGGNKGEDAEAMIKRYHPGTYVILEPIKTLFSNLVKMFKSNDKVTLYNFGLAKKDDKIYVNVLGHGGDATSIFAGNDNGGSCLLRVVNTTQFLLQVGVPCYEVDLITVNCEGCEFEIMEELIASGMVGQFRHVQFATHPTLKHLKNAPERYCEIQEKLKRTHKVSYQYKWCWESWTRKDVVYM